MSPWVPRVLLGLLVAGLAGAIISLSVGEGGPKSIRIDGVEETQQLYGGIRQDGNRLGVPDSSVQIDLYIDLRSTEGSQFMAAVVDPVVEDYVRTGRAHILLHHISAGSTNVTLAAIGATAAGEQGRQWQFAELVTRNLDQTGPHGADEDFLANVAGAVPEFEADTWRDALAAPEATQVVEADAELADQLRLSSAPAIVVTGPSGREGPLESPSLDEVRAAIERVAVPTDVSG